MVRSLRITNVARIGTCSLLIEDAVCARDFASVIRDQRKARYRPALGPFEVAVNAVTTDADDGASRVLEGFQCLIESGDLGGTDERKIARIKKDGDEIGAEVAQPNRRRAPLEGAGQFEIGGGITRSQHRHLLKRIERFAARLLNLVSERNGGDDGDLRLLHLSRCVDHSAHACRTHLRQREVS